jgi:nicotinamidase-related amidase
MNSPAPLLEPAQCALLLIDQQAGLAFGVGSSDRQVLEQHHCAGPNRGGL